MKRGKIFLIAFVFLVGIGGGVAYMERGQNNAYFLEDCAKSCKPRSGVIERRGPNAGPEWRPTSHNLVCTCK